MPEYYKPDLSARNIPSKPRTIDEGAQNFDRNEKAAQESNREIGREEKAKVEAETKQKQEERQPNREAAGRRAEATEKPGPAERMYGQDRMINSQESNERSVTRPQPTQAQLEMKAKREAARQEDRQVAAGKREPSKVHELPKEPTISR